MNQSPHHRRIHGALFALLLSTITVAVTPPAISQESPNPFDERQFLATATPTPTPDDLVRERAAPEKPLPRGLKISIAAVLLVIALVVLAFSVRAWRVGNLFDREYRFPIATSIAARLGARRSGGCMATITFRDRAGPI
jgi:hypothetical protein